MIKALAQTDTSHTTILIRIMTGAVFLSEGIQKFLYPAWRGPGRFESMGFPNAEFFANFVGVFEIVAGILILLGLMTRFGALAMLINISVAIIVTKFPIITGEAFGPFVVRELQSYGFWPMAHEIRTDFAMWWETMFLLIKCGGRWSLDRKVSSGR